MQANLAELAALVGGHLAGPGDLAVSGAAPLRDAGPGQITMVDGDERNRLLSASRAAAIIAPRTYKLNGLPAIQVDDVHLAFAKIVAHFHPQPRARRKGISPLASVSASAKIAANVDIYPFATVGDDVVIGAGTTIHSGVHVMAGSQIGEKVTVFPNAVLYENTVVGPRCLIHANAVLGAYGFGYESVGGRHQLSAQLGNVVLGADVEIGAGSTIDRGTYGSTVIGEGTKIDDLVMVAHNCQLGRHNMLCSQVGIAGSTTTGDYVVLAGQVGVRDHVRLGHRTVVGAKSGVSNDVPDGSRVLGSPAIAERDEKIRLALQARLPEMRHQIKQLRATADELAKRIAALESQEQGAEGR